MLSSYIIRPSTGLYTKLDHRKGNDLENNIDHTVAEAKDSIIENTRLYINNIEHTMHETTDKTRSYRRQDFRQQRRP